MKKSVKIVVIIVLVILIGGGGLFWYRYGSIDINKDITLAEYIKDTTLEVKKDKVLLKHVSDTDYSTVTGTVTLEEGDYIKTDTSGEGVIHWMDDSVTRLAPGTEIHITQLQIDTEDPTKTGVSFDIFNGKVWNKAMNLVNDKASFSLKAGNVVAGIRGTTFDFEKNDCDVTINLLDHAMNVPSLGLDLIGGEKALVPSGTCNKNDNTNSANDNTNSVKIEDIDDSFYQGDWYKNNSQDDKEQDKMIHDRLIKIIEKQLQGTEDPLRTFKLNQTIQQTGDAKEKAKLQFQLSKQYLEQAIFFFYQGKEADGKQHLSLYQNTLGSLNTTLSQIDDPVFVTAMKKSIQALNLLWFKYSQILMIDDPSTADVLEKGVLEFSTAEEKEALEQVFKRRDFFAFTDGLYEGDTSQAAETMLKNYQQLLEKLNNGDIEPYECRILKRLAEKLQKLGVNVPSIFSCTNGQSNLNLNINTNLNTNSANTNLNLNLNQNNTLLNTNSTSQNKNANTRPVNRNTNSRPPQNTNANKPQVDEKALLTKLQGQATALSCSSPTIATQLQGILSQKSKLTGANVSALQSTVSSVAAKCRDQLGSQITDLEKQILGVANEIEGLNPPNNTGEIGLKLNGQKKDLQAKLQSLKNILASLAGI